MTTATAPASSPDALTAWSTADLWRAVALIAVAEVSEALRASATELDRDAPTSALDELDHALCQHLRPVVP